MAAVRNEFQVGLFVIVGLVLFLGSLFAIGSERQIFGTKEHYTTYFSDIKGLNEGAPIRIGGITIGKVGTIEFVPRTVRKNVRVALEVDSEFTNYLKTDTTINLGTQGLLGDKFINISLGVAPQNMPLGQEIPSVESPELSEMADKTAELVSKMTTTVEDIDLVFKELNKKGIGELVDSLGAMHSFIDTMNNSKGLLSSVVNSKELSNNVESIAKNLRQVSSTLTTGKGLLPKLLNDPSGEDIITTLKETTSSLRDTSKAVHALLPGGDDSKGKESIIASLANLTKNLEQVSMSLSKGEGTLGALIMDSTLYDNAIEITDKAKRNVILREAVRQSLK
jgi:phospholipid/cholesterol/gamma-HCH transport system substrate-binding protein